MKPVSKLLFPVIMWILLSGAPLYAVTEVTLVDASPSEQETIGNNWLFVIGINEYNQWPRLNTAVSDAKNLSNVLLENYFFKEKRLIELYNDDATKSLIKRKLKYLAKNVLPEDSLIIFFSGHGYKNPTTKRGSWIPVDGDTVNPVNWLSNDELAKLVSPEAIKAKHILIIADTVFSSKEMTDNPEGTVNPSRAQIKSAYELNSRQILSSDHSRPLTKRGFETTSVLTGSLIKALKINTHQFLTPSSFFNYLKNEVSKNTAKGIRLCQLNAFSNNSPGEFVFILNKKIDRNKLSPFLLARKNEVETLKKEAMEKAQAEQKKQSENIEYSKKRELFKKELELIAKAENKITPGLPPASVIDTGVKEPVIETPEPVIDVPETVIETPEPVIESPETVEVVESILPPKKEEPEETAESFIKKEVPADTSKTTALIGPSRLYIEPDAKYESITFLNSTLTYIKGMEILPGNYSVMVKSPVAMDTSKNFIVLEGEIKTVSVHLKTLSSISLKSLGNRLGMAFKYVNPGTFTMGSPSGDRDENPHQVTLTKGYYLQTTEVTQAQWKSIMGKNPSRFNDCGTNCPVENISWKEVQEFIKKLSYFDNNKKYRLPTEAEWEYACKAGSETDFANSLSINELGWFDRNADKAPHPVAEKMTNAWGFYDMHGNVWEWCASSYNPYPSKAVVDPGDNMKGYYRVHRGGSWDESVYVCRSANRLYNEPDFKRHDIGFRLVMVQ